MAVQDIRPQSQEELRQAIQDAFASGSMLAIEGQGSKRGLGRPMDCATRLSLGGLAGILSYDPEELVLTALAGTSMHDIEAALGERKQHLAFEPPDLAHLWGGSKCAGTLGGVLACNLSGPRRLSAGAARDHFLGFRAVNGLGEVFKAGGKVVKNVTGYDLPKLMTGSFGTLAVMTEVTVKVLPAPEKQRTALFGFETIADAHAFLLNATQSDHEIDGAAILPKAAQERASIGRLSGLGDLVVACRMTGTPVSVTARCAGLKGAGTLAEELHTMNSAELWRCIRDVQILTSDPTRQIWRLSVPPSDGALVLGRILDAYPNAEWIMDWGGGLLWVAIDEGASNHADTIRGAVAAGRGHAVLIRAQESVRRTIEPFDLDSAAAALSRRVKLAFDPKGVLNPGRLSKEW